jgi:hypothetical protein
LLGAALTLLLRAPPDAALAPVPTDAALALAPTDAALVPTDAALALAPTDVAPTDDAALVPLATSPLLPLLSPPPLPPPPPSQAPPLFEAATVAAPAREREAAASIAPAPAATLSRARCRPPYNLDAAPRLGASHSAALPPPPRDVVLALLGDSVDLLGLLGYCGPRGATVHTGDVDAGTVGASRATLPFSFCFDAESNVTLVVVQFHAFHELERRRRPELVAGLPDSGLRAVLAPALRALPAKLGGRTPHALVVQSLFHDLENAQSDMAHLLRMAENSTRGDAAWAAWLQSWLEAVVEPSVRLAAELSAEWGCEMRFGTAWRTSNRIRGGPRDGWLNLRARIPAANEAAARVARAGGARVLDFESFPGSDELRDYMHPAHAAQQAFLLELLANVSRCERGE